METIHRGQHHSTLGAGEKCCGTYTELMVFSNDEVYPEYIIVYRRHNLEVTSFEDECFEAVSSS